MSDERRGAAVVILAGGVGARMQAGQNKVYLQIRDRHMLSYSLETASRCNAVDQIVVVIREDDRALAESLIAQYVVDVPTRVTNGGASRHESEYRGVACLKDEIDASAIGVVAVHDGARPFMTPDLLERVIDAARSTGGAIAARAVEGQLYSRELGTLIDASDYAWAQTPQAFDAATLLASHNAAATAAHEGVDTAEVVEAFSGQSVAIVEGDPSNIKVTFQDDLDVANQLALAWSEQIGR